jgi:hypothetical protein
LVAQKVYFNYEEVDGIPDLEFDRWNDLVFVNGLSLNVDRIGDYNGSLGFFISECGDTPIGWIQDSPIYIDFRVSSKTGERLYNIKFTHEVFFLPEFIDWVRLRKGNRLLKLSIYKCDYEIILVHITYWR